jgi:NAD(P)-dependent dehydrogenase (short-subunit alcohol dehydrogenase family)
MKNRENTILIAGGATGIGLALAGRFLKKGNAVIICGRRQDKLDESPWTSLRMGWWRSLKKELWKSPMELRQNGQMRRG